MIENVWRESLAGISALRLSKLTDEHFDKNAHSRMRVHLAVQVLSMSVWYMLDDYCRNDQAIGKAYSSLMKIVKCLDTVVDIWNHPASKTFDGKRYHPIDSDKHEYVKYLEDVLELFTEWMDESKKAKNPHAFMPKTLYESFAWLVYGVKGVASQIPKGAMMIQSRGGTDDVEQEFARIRQANSNPTIAAARGIASRGNGFRGSSFAKNVKNNTSGEKRIHRKELLAKKSSKYCKK